jgi:hypothetical protein
MATNEIDIAFPTKNYMDVLTWLIKYQKVRNSAPRERKRVFPDIFDISDREDRNAAMEFWNPVVSLRRNMAGVWEKVYYGNRSHLGAEIYLVRDFRLEITDDEWEEMDAITYNCGIYDYRVKDHPEKPTTFDYLYVDKYDEAGPFGEAGRIRNMMADKSKIIDDVNEDLLISAKLRAKADSDKMRAELRSNPDEYIKRAAIISATNGYVNKAVIDYLGALPGGAAIYTKVLEKTL